MGFKFNFHFDTDGIFTAKHGYELARKINYENQYSIGKGVELNLRWFMFLFLYMQPVRAPVPAVRAAVRDVIDEASGC